MRTYFGVRRFLDDMIPVDASWTHRKSSNYETYLVNLLVLLIFDFGNVPS